MSDAIVPRRRKQQLSSRVRHRLKPLEQVEQNAGQGFVFSFPEQEALPAIGERIRERTKGLFVPDVETRCS